MRAVVDDASFDRLIDLKELQRLVPYSRSQIWRLEKQGLFPTRTRLSPGRVAWPLSEILAWIESKKKDRSGRSGQNAHA